MKTNEEFRVVTAALAEATRELKALQQGGWISVEDELPDIRKRVLASNGEIIGHLYRTGNNWRVAASNDFVKVSDVTHWMELPPPPK